MHLRWCRVSSINSINQNIYKSSTWQKTFCLLPTNHALNPPKTLDKNPNRKKQQQLRIQEARNHHPLHWKMVEETSCESRSAKLVFLTWVSCSIICFNMLCFWFHPLYPTKKHEIWENFHSDFELNWMVFLAVSSEVSEKNAPITPWKINMEPTNHPFRKENDLPNLHDYVPC